jgi:Protein of unknown function (DUF2716)
LVGRVGHRLQVASTDQPLSAGRGRSPTDKSRHDRRGMRSAERRIVVSDQPVVQTGRYSFAVEDEAWVELDRSAGNALWAEFADRFQFRAGINSDRWPAIVEPLPSVVWDLSPIFAGAYPGGFAIGCRDVAALVLGTLQDCTEWPETVAFHDWVHPSLLLRPSKVDEPEEVPGWDVGGLFPNGDYTIFVGRDFAFGVLGHPWEQSLLVFGALAVTAFEARNNGKLTTVLRRDGQPPVDQGVGGRGQA